MITKVAMLGFGRFGCAFAARLAASGVGLSAYDPVADIPEDWRATSPQDAAADADLIVLAMPVSEFRRSLEELRPLLRPQQIVMDVGSVKLGPEADLREVLGSERPWVASHPLFGPVSIAKGERRLEVVLCPNPLHPQAVSEVARFLQAQGFRILHYGAEEHDREMAANHALTFFLAKGLLDAGLHLDSPIAPPSAAGIRNSLASVQADAGQLYATLQRANPFAAEVRQKFLEALAAADAALRSPAAAGATAHAEPASLRIAESAQTPPQLQQARELIDDLDRELLQLLARRAELSMRAAHAKVDVGRGVRDDARERSVLEQRRQMASDFQLDREAVAEVFQAIMAFSRRHQVQGLVEEGRPQRPNSPPEDQT